MKLRIPHSLRHAILAAFALAALPVTQGAVMHSEVSLLTYTDFGQNMGRYAVGNVNALLGYIREQAGGVQIQYVGNSHPAYTMQHGMIDFSSQTDGGYGALIGYNAYATVQHNGVWSGTAAGNALGAGNAIQYVGVEYRESNKFLLTPSTDYKITRLSKLITDVTPSVVYGQTDRNWSALVNGGFAGQLLYRAGSGTSQVAALDGTYTYLSGAYAYITGGADICQGLNIINASEGSINLKSAFNPSHNGISATRPMPYLPQPGDSGSPNWVWNPNTQQYEYFAALQSGGGSYTYCKGAPQWTVEKLESYDKTVTLGEGAKAFVYSASKWTEETITDSSGRTASPYQGQVLDAEGKVLTNYIGVKSGVNTWADLSGIKDNDNWYNYGSSYFIRTSGDKESYGDSYCTADYLQTENLVFVAGGEKTDITVMENTDLGIGYVRLSKADGVESASFTIGGKETYTLLNSAGYVVDAGVDVHLQLTNTANYMREWRAVVAGDTDPAKGGKLYIEGKGDTNALLNVGGQGTVYLNRENGHSAYNVLANNGVTVVISDTEQIKRDFTFGYRGGVLDMNGNSMAWNNGNKADDAGFTIHALDEQAIITNLKAGSTTTLTWTQGGTQTWLGSFIDTEGANLKFIYNGGAGSVLTMNSIHTHLANEGSGVTVQSGKLALSGANTKHGLGSLTGTNSARYSSNLDWHYADAATDVDIQSGATFELGSHARLTGDITVAAGGAFIMREGTQHRYEYIEGGEAKEDTQAIRAFYGLKGNIVNNGAMVVQYSEGTDSHNVYAGDISGSGSISVDLGLSGVLEMSGKVELSGAKSVSSGMLIISSGSIGTGETWQVADKGALALTGVEAATALSMVSGKSSGVLAIGKDAAQQLDMSGHGDLFLGAAEGCTVQYGTLGTGDTLTAWHKEGDRNQWLLGGGGGNLVVHWKLSGDNDLVLGNAYGVGTVTLTNEKNDFKGNIIFTEGSNIIFDFTNAAALGEASLDASYGVAVAGGNDVSRLINSNVIDAASKGTVLLDRQADAVVDMTSRTALALGTASDHLEFTGKVTVDKDQAYRFTSPGDLLIMNALEANGTNDLIVDAQGFTDGSVSLMAENEIGGNVLVEGYDSSQSAIAKGGISLILGVDKALDAAAQVTAQQGGALVAASGTTQHLKALNLNNGGTLELQGAAAVTADTLNLASGAGICESVASYSTLSVGGGTLSGALELGYVQKVGSGELVLDNDTKDALGFGVLEVQGGSVRLDKNLETTNGLIALQSGTEFKLNGNQLGTQIGALGDAVLSGSGTVIRSIDAAAGATLSVAGSAVTLSNGVIDKDSASLPVLRLAQSGGTVDFSQVGTLAIKAWDNNGTAIIAGGTVKLPGNVAITTQAYRTAAFSFNHLEINGNTTIAPSASSYANFRMSIASLDGNGNFTWNDNTDSDKVSAIVLSQAGSLSGNLTVQRSSVASTNGSYQTYLELAHKEAAAQATVILNGMDAEGSGGSLKTSYVSLALNAEHVQIKGLQSIGYGLVYAGATPTAEKAGSTAPTSTRNAVLEITGSGNNTYSGSIVGASDKGVSLLMSGSGTQTLNGAGVALRDVTVQSGTLNIDTAATVYGNYSIAQGATLGMSNSLTLNNGQVLAAVSGTDKAAAILNGTLTLNGGSLSFSGNALSGLGKDQYLLQLGGVSAGNGIKDVTVSLTETSSLTDGSTYYLASGNFKDLGLSFSAAHDYLDTTFDSTATGLTVTVKAKNNYLIWAGTNEAYGNEWEQDSFAAQGYTLSSVKAFTFNDSAENHQVKVIDSKNVSKVIVDTQEGYNILSNGSSAMTSANLEKLGSGDLELSGGLKVSGTTTISEGSVTAHGDYLAGAISGDGTLVYDAAGSVDLGAEKSEKLTGTIGKLVIQGSSAKDSNVTMGDVLKVTDQIFIRKHGTLTLTESTKNNVTLDSGTLAVSDASASVQSVLTLQSDSTVAAAAGKTLTLDAVSSTGNASLTKTGKGALVFSSYTGLNLSGLDVQAGSVSFAAVNTTVSGIAAVSLGQDASLELNSGMTMRTQLTMGEGSTVKMTQDYGLTSVLNSAVTVDGSATIGFYRYSGTGSANVAGTITGNGTLTLTQANGAPSASTLSAAITDGEGGALALKVSGGAILSITGGGNFSGGTSIDGKASVTVTNVLALGTGKVDIGDGSTLTLASDLLVGQGLTGKGTIAAPAIASTSGNLSEDEDNFSNGGYVLGIVTKAGETHAFDGNITGGSLTLAVVGEGTQVIAGKAEVAGVTTEGGRLEIAEKASVETGKFALEAVGNTNAVLENVAVEGSSIYGTGDTPGSLQSVALTLSDDITTLTNLRISADTIISGASATYAARSNSGTATNASAVYADATVIVLKEAVNAEILSSSSTLCSIKCTTFQDLVLTGTVTFDFTSLLASLPTGTLTVSFDDSVTVDSNLTFGGIWGDYTFEGTRDGNVINFNVVVPEPSTATLSLLALAALAARRKRKAA